jgi:outer membrane protein insertion porin family
MQSGEEFDYWKSQEDVARLIDFLKERGHLNASVESRWTPTNETEGSLTYLIEAGSPISIRWTGDDPGASIREDVLNRWDGRFPMSFLLPDLTASVSQRLMHERYFEAEVTANVEDDPEGTRTVVFDVRKGTRGRTLTLDFEGNQALSDAELLKALPSTSSLDFFELLQNPERFRDRVRLFYFSESYIWARIGSPRMDFSKTTGDLHVTIPVEEGPLAVVDDIAFEGLRFFDDATLRQQLTLTPGHPFRLKNYSEDRTAMTRMFRREGFTSARVRGRLDATETKLRIVYTIEEGQRQKIGDITVVGSHATHESTIRRELTFRRNDPLRLSDLAETQQRLYELGTFRSVDMRTEARAEDPSTTDVVLRLDETPDVSLGYGLRYSTEDRFEVLTGIRFPSLFGSAHRAGLTVTVNANESVIRGSYSIPYFCRYELGTNFFVSRETEDDEDFSDETWSFTFQQNKRLLENLALQWSYTYQHNYFLGKVTDNSPFPPEFTTRESILTTSLIEDRRDDFIQPSSGRFANVTFQVAPEALGSDIKFIKLFGRLNTFFSLRRDWIWAASYRIGIADAFDNFLLLDNRFTAGGATTVRGFEQDSLGPVDPIYGTVIGGEGLVVINQELRFPISRWFQGVAFYDAGNVFLNASDFRLFDLRHSAGAGLRVVLPFGLLRFDYAWVLDRQPGEKASRFWFNFNHAF